MYLVNLGEGSGDSEPWEWELLLLPPREAVPPPPPKLLIIEEPDNCRRLLLLKKEQITYTVTGNQNGWKAILWSKIRLLWHSINHFKSALIHSFKILCCRKFVDLSNEVLYILVSQGADKLPDVKLWGLKKNLVWAHSNTDLLSKSVFECAHKRFFIKHESLTSGSLSAP